MSISLSKSIVAGVRHRLSAMMTKKRMMRKMMNLVEQFLEQEPVVTECTELSLPTLPAFIQLQL